MFYNIRDITLTRDKANLLYIREDNLHFSSKSCEDELSFNSLLNIVSKLVKFVRLIVSPAIRSPTNI